MKITAEMETKIRQAIITYLEGAEQATRGALLDGATALLGLTPKELEDKRASGKYQTLRSYVGVAVDAMVSEGELRLSDHKYMLTADSMVIVKGDACEKAIRELLAGGSYTKNALFDALDRRFGADKTATRQDENALHAIAGSILSRLVKAGELTIDENGYTKAPKRAQPTSRAMARGPFKKEFRERLVRMGGPFFERFLASLLEKYFAMTGRTVLVCDVTGGSSDGGVDVIVDTTDDLGFFEHILVQAKCRDRAHVTEKEIREFYGAMTALEGSRGIYATTSVFHYGAQKLLDSLDNCVGIDGDKLFELVDKTAYGIVKTRGGYRFDETIFKQ